MDDPLLVSSFERFSDLLRERESFVQMDRSACNSLRQRLAFHELHDERLCSVGLLKAIDTSDVRVFKRGEDFRFSLESGKPLRISGEGIRQDLERYLTFQPRVSGAIHLAHAAAAE